MFTHVREFWFVQTKNVKSINELRISIKFRSNSQSEMVLEECHAKNWLLHSEESQFAVVYYEANHTCGDQVNATTF